MDTIRTCASCGSELRGPVLGGLCPKCVARSAFAPEPAALTVPLVRAAPEEFDSTQFARGEVRYFGNYEILGKIARGGMGYIYKARQLSHNRLAALKLMRTDLLATSAARRRFQIEIEAAARLQHPNIVPIYEAGEHEGRRFFSMALVDGTDVAQQLLRFQNNPRAAAQLVCTIARAVHYAHQQGVIHRDLKPENVLLDRAGRAWLTDFGIAKIFRPQTRLAATQLTRTGDIIGTPQYMAPEQAAGQTKHVTAACDIYSLGAVLYALLTGRPPQVSENRAALIRQVLVEAPPRPSRFNALVDVRLEAICWKCLEKEPRRRFTSAEELADELARYVESRPASTARPGV